MRPPYEATGTLSISEPSFSVMKSFPDRYGTVGNFNLYRRDYVKLYVDTIRPIVQRQDPHRPFVVSSPSNGLRSEEEGHIAQNPYSDLYGDGKSFRKYAINLKRI